MNPPISASSIASHPVAGRQRTGRRALYALLLAGSSLWGLSGCVVAPLPQRQVVVNPGPVYAAPAPAPVYVAPSYASPGVGWVWVANPRHGWGWHHHQHGWHRGWR
ncbi:hypothetical protein PSQ20_02070 [Curvibacter sp. RS43]|nr:hypothetical protein [Curvibacter sp. RS43]MDD0809112.1 hypothetical protein [Curvibacter sp. RS43]